MIDEQIISRINSETDIVALISKSVELKKNGVVWKGLCPFHNEKSPSFTVTPDKGIFYCFGCGKSGDSIKWVQDNEGVGFREAATSLASELSIHIEAESPNALRPPSSTPKRARHYFNDTIEVDINDLLDTSKTAAEALGFDIPYSMRGMMQRKGWRDPVIERLANDRHLGINDRNQMIYLYPNGIKIRADYESSRGDRWLMGGAKGNLWRGDQLDQELVQNVFITEGESDLITLMQERPEGLTDAYIAVAGASSKIDHIAAYRIGFDRDVYLLFDNDEAGRNAELIMRETLKKEAGSCNVYTIDWDNLCRESGKLLNDLGDIPKELMKKLDAYLMGV